MLRLSKKADYALLALRHMAAHSERPAHSARELAEAYDIPAELLAKVLQRLVRARLLALAPGDSRWLRAQPVVRPDFGGRRDSGDRRPADGDGVLGHRP